MSNLERLFERYFEIHPYDIEDNEICFKHFPSINGIYAALHAPEPSADTTTPNESTINYDIPEPSAQADAARPAFAEGLLLTHYEHVKGCPTMDGRRGPCNCHYWDDLTTIRAALSRPADSFTNVNESPPLDVERLAERLRDLRSPGTTSNDERYDLGWYDGLGAALSTLYAALANKENENE